MNVQPVTSDSSVELTTDKSSMTLAERESAEVLKILAEGRKLEAEAADIRQRVSGRWMELFAKPLLTALIAATIAGLATWRYSLELTLGLNELNERHRAALLEDDKTIRAALKEAETKRQKSERGLNEVSDERDRLRLLLGTLRDQAKTQADKEKADAAAERLTNDQQRALEATAATAPPWYAVVASTYTLTDAKRVVAEYASRNPPQATQVFRATDDKGAPVFAITLGGPTSKDNASRLVSEARARALSTDAFAWTTPRWQKVDIAAAH